MSQGPNMRDCMKIIESYNHGVTEEFTTEPFPEYIGQIGREEREQYPALPLTIVAQDDVPTIFMLKGDTLELRPTNIAGEVYSEDNGETYDWDYIAQLSNAGKLEIIVGDDGQPGEMVPYDDNMAIDEDPGDWDHGYNYEANENDFEPATNICPDCEGAGHSKYMDDCERCDGEGEIFEDENDARGKMCGVCSGGRREGYGNDCPNCGGEGYVTEEYDDEEEDPWAERFSMEYAEKEKYKGRIIIVTDVYDGDVYGLFKKKRFMVSSPIDRGWGVGKVSDSEIEVHDLDDDMSTKEKAFLRAWHSSIVNEDGKPYATMKDGPDKYLFRKDQKQKLVGSADNKPEDGEEELEETDMDKFIREMQIAAGIIVEDYDDRMLHGTNECEYCGKENCEQDCDEALGKGEFADDDVNEDCDTGKDKNDDGDCSPFTHADENVEMVREEEGLSVAGKLGKLHKVIQSVNSPKQLAAAEKYAEMMWDETRRGNISNFGIDMKLLYDIRDDLRAKRAEVGGTHKFTRFEEDVDAMGEDLLLAPQDKAGPEVDEEGRDAWSGHDTADFANSYGDEDDRIEPELDRQTDFDAPPRDDGDDSFDMREEGPGEFDHDEDAMIDVGDEEDYKEYDFDDEFETMLGGSSDMPEAELVGMYEMNDLRRLAGLELVMEESDTCSECDGVGEVWGKPCEKCGGEKQLDEIAPVIAAVARGAGAALAKGVMGGGDVEEDRAAGAPITDDLIAYEVNDETAYYVMADILGNELDFGPEDEILVPAARNDQVLVALDQQGFVQGRDFAVAGQMMDDLQNGYNDRKFSDGQDYFPRGANNQPSSDLGPSASGMADNPMANKMRSVEKDDVYETMKLAYRRHRKS